MQYLTFVDYLGYGGKLDEPAFSRLESRARAAIDRETFGKLRNDMEFSDNVKRLMFDLIGTIGNFDISSDSFTSQIASESNDGYAIQYVTPTIQANQVDSMINQLIEQYLFFEKNQAGEPLLSRWV